ncbi:hypothetical protein GOODEAATRI_012268 [Goodea atripinnis]|uniref:Secreted protein n=1 Tax=Goodea atripinnis TaxID=208336 RepID=A0ABV0MRI3_9TELE
MLPSFYLYHLHLLIYFSLQAGGCLDRSPVHHRKTNHAYTLVPKGNSERPVHLTVMFLDCGRKPENPRIHGGTCNFIQKGCWLGFKPRAFFLQGNIVTNCFTMQPLTAFCNAIL